MSEKYLDQVNGGKPGQGDDLPLLPSSLVRKGVVVVGIGASAGGLDAARKLLDSLSGKLEVAVIFVQHLEPTHKSMLVELLRGHTSMTVQQAVDGMLLESGNVYLIAPGTYLSVSNGFLKVSGGAERMSKRLPFDHLLHSMAISCGERAICVVLTGTGTDGSLGLLPVHANGGLVIAQDPDEAEHDGMPRSAVATGGVDLILPLARIGAAIAERTRELAANEKPSPPGGNALLEIIEMLRRSTPHDFTLYKHGTLRRRIERRLMTRLGPNGAIETYLELLREDRDELIRLGKDLLIHVTSFFRDPEAFDYLEQEIIPDLVVTANPARPLRVWIAGCSTGEESYALAMLFREAIDDAGSSVRLQVFASDVDTAAVTTAREGLYANSIEAEVSPERLRRFFTQEEGGYRVSAELRSQVVFAVHDVLADPPFSNLDFVSCRNLMIYLEKEAQAKLVSIFHFALRESGVLLLGNAETIGRAEGRFIVLNKSQRVYRQEKRHGPRAFPPTPILKNSSPNTPHPVPDAVASQHPQFAELCRKAGAEADGATFVLISQYYECKYSLGPTDRYLSVPTGRPTSDLLTLARPFLRDELRSVIQRTIDTGVRSLAESEQFALGAGQPPFSISTQPLLCDNEHLILVGFLPTVEPALSRAQPKDQTRAELEQLLATTRAELQVAKRKLEISAEEHRVVNEEALSINEEYQSTNEELQTSKEEIQSVNEELTALNGQLHETLERQRTTSNDLKNVLDSADLATLFLDANFNIRFFTPSTRSVFAVIPSDIGRPLSDLQSLTADDALFDDAREVAKTRSPIEREVMTRNGAWFLRRILPYRINNDEAEGVVITFSDITERRRAADVLEAARLEAETATLSKSRFLASVSHDLRQPLQTLAIVQGMLARTMPSEEQVQLLSRFDDTLVSMSGMLNTLLDINQIEAGVITPIQSTFEVGLLLDRMKDGFTDHAHARKLDFRTVSSSAYVLSDPRLLEQIVRNLLSNALKYTRTGKVLLGCRRKADVISIEVWDTGIGIPAQELQAIFDEYHQLDNAARERSGGLGLGLSIVQRLADLLGHRIRVTSRPGSGSIFAIEVPLVSSNSELSRSYHLETGHDDNKPARQPQGSILIIEDDPELLDLLHTLLAEEGYTTCVAMDGLVAIDLVSRGTCRPDLILADYNLPNGLDGLMSVARLREMLNQETPVVILTGDISTRTLREISLQNCVQLHKPVKIRELVHILQSMLPEPQCKEAVFVADEPAFLTDEPGAPVVYVVDDDSAILRSIASVFQAEGRMVKTFSTAEKFIRAYKPGSIGCLLVDAYLPGMSGIELVQHLKERHDTLPVIIITGSSDVSMAVRGLKSGAQDFLEKPIGREELLASVDRALDHSRDKSKQLAKQELAASQIASLTPRQRQIMELVLAGHPSKNIASDLGISQRTVENHRASIMKRTGSNSVPSLTRLAITAAGAPGKP